MKYYYYATMQRIGANGDPDFTGNIAEPVRIPEGRNVIAFLGHCTVAQTCNTMKEAIELANSWNNDFAINGTLPKCYTRFDGKPIQYNECIDFGV